jgi:hypothetical protein
MPTFQRSVSVPANGTVENLLTGSQYEFAPYNAACEFAILSSAPGIVCDITTGSDVVAESLDVNPANRFPLLPDDFIAQDVVAAGERIKVRARNTTAAAITVNVCVRIAAVR